MLFRPLGDRNPFLKGDRGLSDREGLHIHIPLGVGSVLVRAEKKTALADLPVGVRLRCGCFLRLAQVLTGKVYQKLLLLGCRQMLLVGLIEPNNCGRYSDELQTAQKDSCSGSSGLSRVYTSWIRRGA